jgi:ABC-type nitrate/sulfonate/bicarbonate transport system permease component
MKATRRWGILGLELATPIVLIALWWALSAHSSSPYFPPLKDIVHGFFQTWKGSNLTTDLLPSVLRFLVGFAIALLAGISIGLLLGLSPRARRDLSPLTEFSRALPIAALVPVGLVILGPGATMEIALIAFGCVWPILVASTDGVRGVDPVLLDTARAYGLSRRQRIRTVVLPAALPQIAAGVRIAIGIGIATMVIANIFGATSGLGYFVIQAQQSFDVLGTWAGLLMIGLIGVLANGLYLIVQHRLLAWHRGWRASTEGS